MINTLEKTLENLKLFYLDKVKEPALGMGVSLRKDIKYWSEKDSYFKNKVEVLDFTLSSRLERKHTSLEYRREPNKDIALPTLGDFSFQQTLNYKD